MKSIRVTIYIYVFVFCNTYFSAYALAPLYEDAFKSRKFNGISTKEIEENDSKSFTEELLSHFQNSSQYREWVINQINVSISKNSTILSLGAGLGFQEQELKRLGHNVTAIEYYGKFADKIKEKGIGVITGDARKIINNVNKKFDVILISESLGALGLNILDDIKSILKTNGKIIIEEYPYWEEEVKGLKEYGIHVVRFLEEEIYAFLTDNKSYNIETYESSPQFAHDKLYDGLKRDFWMWFIVANNSNNDLLPKKPITSA